VPRIHQIHVDPARVEDLVERNPVDAGGLHRDGGHTTLLQPLHQPMQIGSADVAVSRLHGCLDTSERQLRREMEERSDHDEY